MKLRRIFAAIAACAVAATMAISASAADTVTIKGQSDMTKDSKTIGKADTAKAAAVIADFGIDPAKIDTKSIAKITVDVQVDTGYCNGAMGANLDGAWAQTAQIDNTDDKAKTWEWELTGEIDLSSFQIQVWWINPFATYDGETLVSYDKPGTVTMSNLKLLDKDGKEVGVAAGEETKDPSSSEAPKDSSSTASATDKNEPTGATAGLALAGLAIAGAAVVAAKKSK